MHDDRNVHVYDWTEIAETVGLEIVPLDRPFSFASSGDLKPGRGSLWFHNSSWWGVLPGADGLVLSRLEDGTFRPERSLGQGNQAAVWSSGANVVVMAAEPGLSVQLYTYEPSKRQYLLVGEPTQVVGIGGPMAELAVKIETGRGWITHAALDCRRHGGTA